MRITRRMNSTTALKGMPACSFEKEDCHAYRDGTCDALTDTEFGAERMECPFYRSRDDNIRESSECMNRLLRIGRTDLIEKYRPVYMRLNSRDGKEDFIRAAKEALNKRIPEIQDRIKTRIRKVSDITEEWYE